MVRIHRVRSVLIGLAAALHAAGAGAASLAEIEQRGYLTVGVSTAPSPFESIENGKPTGFDADLLDALAKSAKFELRRVELAPAAFAEALHSGRIDLTASSIEVTPARQHELDFPAPLAETTAWYLTRQKHDGIDALADLSGRRVGMPNGPAALEQANELEHRLAKANGRLGPMKSYPDYPQALQALDAGEVDYVVGAVSVLAAEAQRAPDRFALGQAVGQRRFAGWSVAKGNAELAKYLADFFTAEQKSGALAAVQEKWLGHAVTDLPDQVTAQYWWMARQDRAAVLPIPERKDPD